MQKVCNESISECLLKNFYVIYVKDLAWSDNKKVYCKVKT